jgi:hypothetical protein
MAGAPQGQQFNAGQAVNMVGGAASLIGNAVNMSRQRLNINDYITPPMSNDPRMKPVYTAGQANINARNATPQGASTEEILGATLTGASTGSAAGPWGAVIGGVVGLGSALIGGGEREKAQRREKRRAMSRVTSAQQTFNTADSNYRQRQGIIDTYNRRNNYQARLANVYRNQ